MAKKYLDLNVYEAALQRLDIVFKEFDVVTVSLSGGKDSTLMYQLTLKKALEYNKKINVLYIDMEGQYLKTIEHIHELLDLGKKQNLIDNVYWVCLPLSLRNAVSNFEPKWVCWDKNKRDLWLREQPEISITLENNIFPFYKYGMEFEEFVPAFEKWEQENNPNKKIAHLVGIRTQESLNRWRTIASTKKGKYKNYQWTTKLKNCTDSYSVFPIYDWRTEDIWIATFKYNLLFNEIYELMYKNGMSIHEQRLCQPFGDDQKNGLDQYKFFEPENWEKMLKRVSGVNFGNIYCKTTALGHLRSEKPEHLTWEEYAIFLLETIGFYNKELEKHYKEKINKFLLWHEKNENVKLEDIPQEVDSKLESSKKVATWRRIARSIEKNDFYLSRLSFSQNKSDMEKLEKLISKYDNLINEESSYETKMLNRSFNEIKNKNTEK